MKPAAAALIPLIATSLSFAQDPQLRSRAVEMLERANQASTSPHLPDLERTDTFRVLDATTGPDEGSFSRVVVQGTGRRDELTFGSYHVINVWTRGHLATVRTAEVIPPPLVDMLRLTPINLVRFDHEDVIYAITEGEANGRPAHCIEFNTIAGTRNWNNELCVDAQNGTLVREKLDNRLIENSDFFPFAGELVPGTIRVSFYGVPHLAISQTLTELSDPTPNVLAAPPNAQIRQYCTTFRRAFGVNMPQPKPGTGGETEVVLRGLIGQDGKVHDAVVESTERPDLNSAALQLIQQWTFTPATCNGQATSVEASFTLHFQ
jgi:TonB family protein